MSKGELIKNFAEMLYANTPHKEGDAAELKDAKQSVKEQFEARVVSIMLVLDKLNMEIVPRRDRSKDEENAQNNVDVCTEIVKAFVAKLKSPKGVADMFPCEELAHWIIDGRKE